MNINTMDVFFGYNMRVGDIKGLTKSAAEYAELAKTASTAEQREGYANAVIQINKPRKIPSQQRICCETNSNISYQNRTKSICHRKVEFYLIAFISF